MKETKGFLSIEEIKRMGIEVFYLYKNDDNLLEILKEIPEEIEDLEDLEIIMATEDAQDIADYLKDYYHYTDLEVEKYLSDYDIILWRYETEVFWYYTVKGILWYYTVGKA